MNDRNVRFNKLTKEQQQYLLNTLASHLRQAGYNQKLYNLIDEFWMNLKLAQTFSHLSFMEDVKLAIEVASRDEAPTGFVELIRNCLIHATIIEHAAQVQSELLGMLTELGQLAKAQGYVALKPDVEQQTKSFKLIYELLSHKNVVEGITILEKLLQTLDTFEDDESIVEYLFDLALGNRQILEEPKAQQLVNRLRKFTDTVLHDEFKAHLLPAAVMSLCLAGEFERALATVDMIDMIEDEDEIDRVNLMLGASLMLLKTGQKEWSAKIVHRGFELAQMIPSVKVRPGLLAQLLSNMVYILIEAGETEYAIEIINQTLLLTTRVTENDIALGYIVLAFVQVGEFERAAATAKLIQEKEDRQVYMVIVLVLARELEDALMIAQAIEDKTTKVWTLCRIAIGMVEVGNLKQAVEILNYSWIVAETLEDEKEKIEAKCNVAIGLLAVDKKEQAVGIANNVLKIIDGMLVGKVSASLSVAQVLTQAGMKEQAIKIINQALKQEEALSYSESKEELLSSIAQNLAILGKFEQALLVVETIEAEGEKTYALSSIAIELMQVGRIEQAVGIANSILAISKPNLVLGGDALSRVSEVMALSGENDGFTRSVETFAKIRTPLRISEGYLIQTVKRLAQVGKFDYALSATTKLNGFWKAWAINDITQAMVKAGEFEYAMNIAISRGEDETLSDLAQNMAQVREIERALLIADAIGDDWKKANVLSNIAKILVQVGEKKRAIEVASCVLLLPKPPGTISGEALANVTQVMALADEKAMLHLALNRLVEINNEKPGTMISLLRDTADSLIEAGERTLATEMVNRALIVIEAIKDEAFKIYLLNDVVPIITQTGAKSVIDYGLALTETCSNELYKMKIWIKLAQALLAVGEKEIAIYVANKALPIAKEIGSIQSWAKMFGRITRSVIRPKKLTQVLVESVELMEHKSSKLDMLENIAEIFAKAGEFEQTLAIAEITGERNPSYKIYLLREVAVMMAHTGEFKRSMDLVETIPNGTDKEYALCCIAEELAKSGEFEHALAVIKKIKGAFPRTEVLIRAAHALAQAEEFEYAYAIIGIASVTSDTESTIQVLALSNAAYALARAGKFEHILAVLKETIRATNESEHFTRAIALSTIAQAIAMAGDREYAAQLAIHAFVNAKKVQEPETQDAFNNVIQAMAQIGWDYVFKATKTTKEEDKEISLGDIIRVIVQTGHYDQTQYALKIALKMAGLIGRDSVFSVLQNGLTALAALDKGETLWRIYEVVNEVERWWAPRRYITE